MNDRARFDVLVAPRVGSVIEGQNGNYHACGWVEHRACGGLHPTH